MSLQSLQGERYYFVSHKSIKSEKIFKGDTVHGALSHKFSRCAMVCPCFTGHKFTLLPDQVAYSSVLMTEELHTCWNIQIKLQEPDGGTGLYFHETVPQPQFPFPTPRLSGPSIEQCNSLCGWTAEWIIDMI